MKLHRSVCCKNFKSAQSPRLLFRMCVVCFHIKLFLNWYSLCSDGFHAIRLHFKTKTFPKVYVLAWQEYVACGICRCCSYFYFFIFQYSMCFMLSKRYCWHFSLHRKRKLCDKQFVQKLFYICDSLHISYMEIV